MCDVLGVSKSGYYDWKRSQIGSSDSPEKDYQLKRDIEDIFQSSRQAYGSPRVHHMMKVLGYTVRKTKVERIMRELNLRAKKRRKFKKTTIGSKKTCPSPNLLAQNFTSPSKGSILLMDITYIPLMAGFAYLAAILDLCTKEIVGWKLEKHMEAELVRDALLDANLKGHIIPGGILHSDRGSQFGSIVFRRTLKSLGLQQSMSGTGNCYDNAPMESFFDSLKTEMFEEKYFKNYEEARKQVFEWIEIFYNRQRIHSSIGYQIPACYAEKIMAKAS